MKRYLALLLLLLMPIVADAATVSESALGEATAVASDDYIRVIVDGNSKKATPATIATTLGLVSYTEPETNLPLCRTAASTVGQCTNLTDVVPLVAGGALGTPATATLTNATGLPISTGVSGLGTGIATALAVNAGSVGAPARIIASGANALDFGSTLTGACATVIQVAATGVVSTDVIIFNPNASIKAVTGYVPASTGGFSVTAFPTTGYVNFEACNWTAGTVDPGSITVNWMVIR